MVDQLLSEAASWKAELERIVTVTVQRRVTDLGLPATALLLKTLPSEVQEILAKIKHDELAIRLEQPGA